MTKQQQITAFVDRYVRFPRISTPHGQWISANRWAMSHRYGQFPRPTVEAMAQELIVMGEFRALDLGGWLGTTDGQVITRAVESVTPPFYQQDIELTVAALQRAARMQHEEGQQVAGRVALTALGVGVGLAGLFRLFAGQSGGSSS